jgi:CheY-like chemotaxis protein
MALKQLHFGAPALGEQTGDGQVTISSRRHAVVLLIDHEQHAMSATAAMLEAAGYHCLCSTDESSASECVGRLIPDLIISEINVAGHNGLALCERLLQGLGLPSLPVMFLSSTQIPDIIRRTHAAGGTYYLRKPCDTGVLLELIAKALWTQRLEPAAMARN